MFVWMMVILKIPIAALLWLVWWSSKTPEPQEEEPARVDARPDHRPDPRSPRRPRPPRRGPHAEPAPTAPSRVRAHAAGSGRRQPLR
ncbi:MAG: hypothetical protein QOG86_1556 [Thermoleophilaceae bacterium]|jgi:hypothetical protein|nr:hypothetical protein [Thermoleophilaceae bacterium]MEA2350615.1 hypothetical protein [Thermoleophilaceae bacterium]MEA2353014.1 hypothetical protein [Thermoleophilaceae bacterium]MEA2367290.1 hypothetical protein [Thermoleophilaceae bacterium]